MAIDALVEVPSPRIVLLGCKPLVPRPDPSSPCPVCGGGIKAGEDSTYCGQCDAVSPRTAARIKSALWATDRRAWYAARQSQCQVEADRLGDGRPARPAARPDDPAGDGRTPRLSERHRRQIEERHGEVGRAWLRAIGQLPDWSLQLDSKGRPIRPVTEASQAPAA